MRQLAIYLIVALSSGLLFVSTTVAAKIKHRGSVYVDSTELSLRHPEGVGCNETSFVVADTGNSQLVRYAMTAQSLTPEVVFPLPETSPIMVQIDSGGGIYILDGKTRTIIKMTQDGQVTGTVEPKGLPAPKAFIPRSFKLDTEDNLFLLDIFSARVLMLNGAGEFIKQFPFPEGHRFFSDLAVSSHGMIYLLDSVAGAIYVADPGEESFKLLSGGLKDDMNFPTSLAIDSNGSLYLSDQYGSGLALIARDGSFQGRKFSMGWEDGQLYYPAQLCINNQDTLIIADRNNSRVQVFSILED